VFLPYALLLIPVAATCGWYAGRKERSHDSHRNKPSRLHQDYFIGLNYLINEEPDKAVDVFIKLLEVDSDTVETHLALGSLFRRRGEVDRAIRIHQNLIARPQLATAHKTHALSALGQDYLRAGVLDRAERLFLELVEMGDENQQSLRFLLNIYQQEKDWCKAIAIAQKLAQTTGESMHIVIAQYYCELAEQMIKSKRVVEAFNYLKRANAIDHSCVRASLIRASLEIQTQEYKEAIRSLKRVLEQDSDYISEIIQPLSLCYQRLNDEKRLVAYLEDCLQRYPSVSIVLAISDYLKNVEGDKAAIEFIAQHINLRPSLRGLNHLVGLYLSNSVGEAKEKLKLLQKFMQMLLKDKPVYQCEQCGFAGNTLYWTCPSCHNWAVVKPIQGLEGN